MPFRSVAQREWMKHNRPDLYAKWKAEHGTKIAKKRNRTKRSKKK